MTRLEVEKKLVEMAEEIKRFYEENVPNGGALSITFGIDPLSLNIYNDGCYKKEYSGIVDVIIMKDSREVVSMGHDDEYGKNGNILRTKEGVWKL